MGLGYWLMSFLEHLLCILWYSVIVRHRIIPSSAGVFYTYFRFIDFRLLLFWFLGIIAGTPM